MKNEKDIKPVEKKVWVNGLESETDFWRRFLSDLPDNYFRLDAQLELQDFAVPYIEGKQNPRLLEIGSGPLPGIGKVRNGKRLEIVAVDPLGDVYMQLLAEENILPIVPVMKGKGEELEEIFKGEPQFDFVFCANALDHSLNPIEIIKSAINVTVDRGGLRFTVHKNEAEFMKYSGLHQWNFEIKNDKVRIWNRSSEVFLDEHLNDVEIELEMTDLNGREELVIDLKKL